jgi:DNA-binding MarR family transcriptional regulator
MSFNITLPERMVLESLQQSSKNVTKLNECTKLERGYLNNILPSLISKGLISQDREHKYEINKNINNDIKKELHDKKNVTTELNEIVGTCIRDRIHNNNESAFKLKKVFLTAREQKIFKGLIYNIETFLSSADNKSHNTADQTLFFWGENNYGKVTNNILNF